MVFAVEYLSNEIVPKQFFPTKVHQIPQELCVLTTTSYKGRCCTFQAAMKLLTVVGQCFGLNPVLGVLENDSSKLRFKWISARCFYAIVAIFGQSAFVGFNLFRIMKDKDASMSSSITVVFFSSNCLTAILFLRIAMHWPALCRYIAKTEAIDPNPDYKIIKKCNVTCVLILSLALMEHILSDVAGLAVALDCNPDTNLYEAFIVGGFPWIFNYVPYDHFRGILVQIINLQSTFNWNFADVFVICVSFYLTSRLEQINKRISAVRGKYIPPRIWRTMREDYNRVIQLVRKVDDVISGIIFVSFANNLFFICVQLLHTLEDGLKGTPICHSRSDGPFRGYEHAVYFVYSFMFLMSRSLAVSLISAQVHSATLEAAPALYDVPSPVYCIEVQRFINQINGDTIALSGLKFFYVKRGLVLTIAGTIVTYELVLMQFAGVTPTSPPATMTT